MAQSARRQWLAGILIHATMTSRSAASVSSASASSPPTAFAARSLAFSILCRTHQPSCRAVPLLYHRSAPLRRRPLSSNTAQAAMCAEGQGTTGEGSCRGWGEDVWEEQLNIRHLEKAGARPQFFRTSCVFAPNKPADLIDTMVAERGVSVVLDLRSLDEMKTDIASKFSTRVYKRDAPPSLEAAVEAAAQGKLVRYVVPLLERDFILPSLRKRLPLGLRLSFIWAGLTNSRREQELMVQEINKIGLGGLNELMLDGCGPEILWALQLMASLRQIPSAAVAVQCRLGKDRTGLISALVKSTLGASEEDIIADYKLSEGIDEIALGELQQRMEVRRSRADLTRTNISQQSHPCTCARAHIHMHTHERTHARARARATHTRTHSQTRIFRRPPRQASRCWTGRFSQGQTLATCRQHLHGLRYVCCNLCVLTRARMGREVGDGGGVLG